MQNKIERNSSIELLRIIALIGVVILHYNDPAIGGGFQYVQEGSINQLWLYISESIFICAVNLFIIVSAYFLCTTKQRRLIKIVELIIQVIIFQFIAYFIGIIEGKRALSITSFLICILPLNYFVILYSVLYVISPYLNLVIEKLNKKKYKRFLFVLVFIFSCWSYSIDLLENISGTSFMGISPIGLFGSQNGYSIINFIVLYFIGSYIRIYGISINKKRLIMLLVIMCMAISIGAIFEHKLGLMNITMWNYNNPLVIMTAVLIFLLFAKMNFKNTIINELAKGSFTCYLFHAIILTYIKIQETVNNSFYNLILHQIIVAILIYMLAYIVYRIYKIMCGWIINLISPYFDRINISLE